MSDCPVCGKAGVDEDATRCPRCHADLECFTLLDAPHEAAPAPRVRADLMEVKHALGDLREAMRKGRTSRGRRWVWLVSAVVAGLAALILVMQFPAIDRRSAELLAAVLDQARIQAPESVVTATTLQAVTGGIERLAGRLKAIEGRLDVLVAAQGKTVEQATAAGERVAEIAGYVRGIEDNLARLSATAQQVTRDHPAVGGDPELVLHHHLRRGETLWSIAKRYYGRGQLYPVLIAQNPGLGPYHHGARVLRILEDPEQAEELYRRITPPGAEGRLFRYRVEPGDDWPKLARRFLGRPGRAPELIALNPTSELKPGEQVLIALE